jgi:exosome complex component RRP40
MCGAAGRGQRASINAVPLPPTMSHAPPGVASAVTFVPSAGAIVVPGDVVATLADVPSPPAAGAGGRANPSNLVRLGTGVAVADAPSSSSTVTTVIATKAGAARFDARRSKVWIDGNQRRRYDPVVGDAVVAIVTDRHAEEYRVDMAATDTATLPALGFEGATKRNKPALVVGSSVYCRITRASRHMECEASCVEPGSSRSWVTGETLYGELKGGNLVDVSLALAARLAAADSPILGTLGASIPFESAVGANGRVWIKSSSTRSTVLLCLLVAKADTLALDAWRQHVSRVLSQYKP